MDMVAGWDGIWDISVRYEGIDRNRGRVSYLVLRFEELSCRVVRYLTRW